MGWLDACRGRGKVSSGRVAGSSGRSALWERCARELAEGKREGVILVRRGRGTSDEGRRKREQVAGQMGDLVARAKYLGERERKRERLGQPSDGTLDGREGSGLVGVGGKFGKRKGC